MIGDRIKSRREKKGYSITELAALAGVSKSYLSYIERNVHNNPSLQVLSKIAAPLESSLEFLLGDETGAGPRTIDALDEEWSMMIRQAVDEGMSKKDFHAMKELLVLKKWKNAKNENDMYIYDRGKSSNIIILRIDS